MSSAAKFSCKICENNVTNVILGFILYKLY